MSDDNYKHPPMEKEQLLQVIECIKTICKTATSEKMAECVTENSVEGGMNSVGEFHAACDGPVFSQEKPCQFSNDRELRMSLLKEEFQEYVQAEEDSDIVAVADALADMLYIIFGTAHAYNIPLDEIFSEVHSTNMAKVGKNGKVKRREDGKILKPEGWEAPQISKMIQEFNKGKELDASNLLYEFRRLFVNRELAKQLDQMFETMKTVGVVEKLKEEQVIDELVDHFTKNGRSYSTSKIEFYPERIATPEDPVRFVPPPPEPIRFVPPSLDPRDDDQWSWCDDSKKED
jgi:predicted HAD superfamily Cof-like phosphohydrolase